MGISNEWYLLFAAGFASLSNNWRPSMAAVPQMDSAIRPLEHLVKQI